MGHENDIWIVVLLFLAGSFTLANAMLRQRFFLRRLDKKMDALLKAQGIEWKSLSPEVQRLAQNPSTKIAAIKLLREENPDIGLAEAKAEVEAFAAKKD